MYWITFLIFCLSSCLALAITPKKVTEAIPAPTTSVTKAANLLPLMDDSDNDKIAWKTAPEKTCGLLRDQAGKYLEINDAADDYIFLPIPNLITGDKNSKLIELHFYKDKDMKTEPAFTLDKAGLRNKNSVICKWPSNIYKDNGIYYLTDCKKEFRDFLGYLRIYEETYCSVINAKSANGENPPYEVKIGNQAYYLDVSSLETINKNKIFWSKKERAKQAYELLSYRATSYTNFMATIKQSPAFKKLNDCYWKGDIPCISEFISPTFKHDIQDFCKDVYPAELQLDYSLSYIREFINFINLVETNKIEMNMVLYPDDLVLKDMIYFKPEKFHSGSMTDPSIGISFKNGVLLLNGFDYGVSC